MKKKYNVVIVALSVLIFAAGFIYYEFLYSPKVSAPPVAAQNRDDQWIQDITYFAEELPRVHKNLFFQMDKGEFFEAVDKLKGEVSNITDVEIKLALARLAAMVGDGHTQVSLVTDYDKLLLYPIRLYWFLDGLYIVNAAEQHKNLYGCKVLGIEGVGIAAIEQEVNKLISKENEMKLKADSPFYMINTEVLRTLKIIKSEKAVFNLQNSDGSRVDVELEPRIATEDLDWISKSFNQGELPLYRRNRDKYYWYELIPEKKAVYVHYSACSNMEDKSFKAFSREVMDAVDKNGIEKVIIDLRLNGGGNSLVFRPLLNALKKHPGMKNEGALYGIVGRSTFSSAILNALELKNSTKITFAGEKTAGKPNHFGEVKYFSLPNSKLQISYSIRYFKYTKIDTPSFIPDKEIAQSSYEFFEGRDIVLEHILGNQ